MSLILQILTDQLRWLDWFIIVSHNHQWSKSILHCNIHASHWNLSPCLWRTWIFIVQCSPWFVQDNQCCLHLWRWQWCAVSSGGQVTWEKWIFYLLFFLQKKVYSTLLYSKTYIRFLWIVTRYIWKVQAI